MPTANNPFSQDLTPPYETGSPPVRQHQPIIRVETREHLPSRCPLAAVPPPQLQDRTPCLWKQTPGGQTRTTQQAPVFPKVFFQVGRTSFQAVGMAATRLTLQHNSWRRHTTRCYKRFFNKSQCVSHHDLSKHLGLRSLKCTGSTQEIYI